MRFRRVLLILLGLVLLVIVGFVIWILLKTPSHDRVWSEEYSKLVTAKLNGDTVTLRNVRDWSFVSSSTPIIAWQNATIRRTDIESAWFFIDRFSTFEPVAHTSVSFLFKDGSALGFSIEARREADETYSMWGGLTREYELHYLWGTERDFVTRSMVHFSEPVEMYRLALSPEQAQKFFMSVIEETNTIAKKPRFYHLLLANCTNLLARAVNEHYPGTLPYDLSWNFPGLSLPYLVREGYIPLQGTLEETAKAASLDPFKDQIPELAKESSATFSKKLRALTE